MLAAATDRNAQAHSAFYHAGGGSKLDDGIPPQRIADLDVLRRLQRMGEEIGESELSKFAELGESVEAAMAGLAKVATAHAP